MAARGLLLGKVENIGTAELMLPRALGCSPERQHENMGRHNPLDSPAADHLNDVEQPVPILEDRRLLDEKHIIHLRLLPAQNCRASGIRNEAGPLNNPLTQVNFIRAGVSPFFLGARAAAPEPSPAISEVN